MNKLQEKAINLARTVLFNEFSYNANKITTEDMYVIWFSNTLHNQDWQAFGKRCVRQRIYQGYIQRG